MPSNRPFDLAKLDLETIRKKKRRKLLLSSAPFTAVMLVIALKLVAMNIGFGLGQQAYTNGDYPSATNWFNGLQVVNVFEPYKANFAKGTAELVETDYAMATNDLQAALNNNVPHDFECQVRVNLTLAWIGAGDKQLQNKKYDDAILSYDKAKAVVDGRDCGLKLGDQSASDQTKQADKKLNDARKSASNKQNAAKQARNGDDSKASQSANDSTQDKQAPPSQDQQQKLENQQKSNARKLNKQRNNSRYNNSRATNDYNSRNW